MNNNLFKSITLALIFFTVSNLNAQISLPVASSWAKTSSTVGLTTIDIEYSRPKMKGRKIFGAGDSFLVPFGKLWRTGANSGTKITLPDDIMINGKNITAGEYLLFSVPGAESWEVMLYSDIKIGGNTANYNQENEALKVTVKPENLNHTVETFTVGISDISEDNTTANIEIIWERTSVKIPFKVDFDSKVMAEIKEKTSKDNAKPADYQAAANYYFQTDRDINQAVEWMDKYMATNDSPQFWTLHSYAKMLYKKGDYAAARTTAEKSLSLASESDNDFGYIKLNEELIASLPEDKGKKSKKKKKKK